MNENLVNEHFKQKGEDFIALVNFINLKGLYRNNVITLGLIKEIKELLSFKRNEKKTSRILQFAWECKIRLIFNYVILLSALDQPLPKSIKLCIPHTDDIIFKIFQEIFINLLTISMIFLSLYCTIKPTRITIKLALSFSKLLWLHFLANSYKQKTFLMQF